MTPNEVFRTAHTYKQPGNGYSFGDGLKHGINEVCIACKAPAHPLHGDDLKPFADFYKSRVAGQTFGAYGCGCGAKFSWYKRV